MFAWRDEGDGSGYCVLDGLIVGDYCDWSKFGESCLSIHNGGPMTARRFYFNSPDAVSVNAWGSKGRKGKTRVSCVGAAKAWVEQRVQAWVDENLERDAA